MCRPSRIPTRSSLLSLVWFGTTYFHLPNYWSYYISLLRPLCWTTIPILSQTCRFFSLSTSDLCLWGIVPGEDIFSSSSYIWRGFLSLFGFLWFGWECCFSDWYRWGVSPWEDTGDHERKALSSCLGWSPGVWYMWVRILREVNGGLVLCLGRFLR